MANIYLAAWEWVSGDDPHWQAPGGTAIGSLNLRTTAQTAAVGGAGGPGIFVYSSPQTISEAFDLGSVLDRVLSNSEKNNLRTRLGLSESPDGTVLDLLWNLFTRWSDPLGVTAPKPLTPTQAGNLELHLGGFSPIRVERFRLQTHPHAPKVLAVLREDYRQQRAFDLAHGRTTYKKLLTAWAAQFNEPYQAFIADGLPDEGMLPRETSLGDTFNRADNTDLNAANDGKTLNGSAGSWQWAEVEAGGAISSNQLTGDSDAQSNSIRAEQDLSSANHEASITVTGMVVSAGRKYMGPAVRFQSTASTYYMYRLQNVSSTDDHGMRTVIDGTASDLGTPTTENWTRGAVARLVVDGSTVTAYIDDVQKHQETDTQITGGVRVGVALRGISSSANGDDWTAEDLAVPQFARPTSDIAAGNWTPTTGNDLFAMVDEETPSDADYIQSGASPSNDLVKLALGSLNTPGPGTVTLRIRHRKTP